MRRIGRKGSEGFAFTGLDYAEFSDWAAINFHFRDGQKRLDLNHAWICRDSPTLGRVRAPWQKWVDQGLCTFVEDVSISPELLADYIATMGRQYTIRMLAMDNFRWSGAIPETLSMRRSKAKAGRPTLLWLSSRR